MDIKKIVLPTDFSSQSQAALDLATALARDSGATLLIVHVQEPPSETVAGGGLAAAPLGPDAPALEEELRQVAPQDPAVRVERHLLQGDPAGAIVRFAEQVDADLVVLGTHGRTGLAHLLMGSVAEAVVRRAPCPVLTVKAPARRRA